MLRHTVTIGTRSYDLAQGHALDELTSAMVGAIQEGGAFVDFVVFGNRRVSVLVTSGLPIVFESTDVEADDRDTGDEEQPFAVNYLDL
jgi:hypothetical protein